MSEGTKKIKVVVIDDHEVVREGLVSMINLQPDMLVAGQADSAHAGLKIVQETNPDIVVSDIAMPGQNPFDVVKDYKAANPLVKVVFLTAFDTDGNVQKAFKSGGAGFVTKSEPFSNVATAVRTVNGGAKYYSAAIESRILTKNENDLHSDIVVRRELLSPREIEVLCNVAKGHTAKQIASSLHISSKTVERHKSNIMTKLGMHTQVELTRYAIREGIISI